MKTTITTPATKPVYPYIGTSDTGSTVLFTGEETGVCITSLVIRLHYLGRYSGTLIEEHFTKVPDGAAITITTGDKQ